MPQGLNRDQLKDFLERNWLSIPSAEARARRGIVIEARGAFTLLSYGRRGPFSNWVLPSRVGFSEGSFAEAIDAAERFFKARGTPYSWEVSEAYGPWLEPRLREIDHHPAEVVECLVCPLDGAQPPARGGLITEEIRDLPGLERAMSIDDSYDEHTPEHFQQALARAWVELEAGDRRWFLGSEKGEAVSVASLKIYKDPPLAYLNGATTLPAHRQRGFYTTLLQARLQAARAQGLAWVATHAVSDSSAPILKKRGFERLSTIKVYQALV